MGLVRDMGWSGERAWVMGVGYWGRDGKVGRGHRGSSYGRD